VLLAAATPAATVAAAAAPPAVDLAAADVDVDVDVGLGAADDGAPRAVVVAGAERAVAGAVRIASNPHTSKLRASYSWTHRSPLPSPTFTLPLPASTPAPDIPSACVSSSVSSW
jgi:hypothetical protein